MTTKRALGAKAVLLVGTMLSAAPAWAQAAPEDSQQQAPDEAQDLQEIVVTGTTSRDRPLITSSADITFATREDIDRRAPRSTADLLELVPGARIGHIGLQRDEMTAVASRYYSKLPARVDDSFVLMIDPMLATGGSAVAALDVLRAAGARAPRIVCIVAAPEGLAVVERHYPQIDVYTPAVDARLNAEKYIVPGLGDFGDRLYGTA